MPTQTDRTARVRVRWFQRTDLPLVYRLTAGDGRLSHRALVDCLESVDTVGLVAERHGQVVGFLSYRLIRELNEVAVLAVWVHPEWRRRGVGSALLHRVAQKAAHHYHVVSAAAPEDQLGAQQFFLARGFRAADVVRRAEEPVAVIVMERRLPVPGTPAA